MVVQPSFRDTIIIFFRRKTAFLVSFLIVCAAGAAYLAMATPLYQSAAALVLRFDTRTAVPNIDRSLDNTQALMQGVNEHQEILHSDAEILRSADIARSVIGALGLEQLYPRIAAAKLPDRAKMEDAVRAFSANLVVNTGIESDVINVIFFARTPILAQQAVQKLLAEFYGQEAAIYANPQLRFTEGQASDAKKQLTDAQTAFATFKQQHQIADLAQQVQELLKQRTDVSSRLAVAQGVLLAARQQEQALQQLLASVPAQVTSSATGEQYQAADAAASELDALKAKRDNMASTYRPSSPVLRSINAQIASLQRAVGARASQGRTRVDRAPNRVYESIKTDELRAEAQSRSAQQPVDVLQSQLDDINKRIAELESQQNRYDDLARAVQIQADTYRAVAIRYQEARIEANRNAEKISAATVITAPTVPDRPAKPRKKLVLAATLLLAALFGGGVVLALEAFDDRLRTPREVAHVLRLPVLATFSKDA